MAGAVGWQITLWRLQRMLGEEMYTIAGKFQQGLGASPSTYGLAVTAALLLAPGVAVGPAFGAEGEPIETASAINSWGSTVIAVFLLPTATYTRTASAYRSEREIEYEKREDGMCYLVLVSLAMALHTLLHGGLTALDATGWMVLYHWKPLGKTAYKQLVKGQTFQSSDHATHFGGACVGLVTGIVLGGGGMPGPWVLVSMVYLGVRAWFDV